MVNVVGPSLGGISFFPASRQGSSSSGSGVGACCKGASGGVDRCTRGPGDLSGIRSFQHVIGKNTTVMIVASSICFSALGAVVDRLVCRGPIPRRTPCVVIDIVSPSKRINPTLPAGKQGSELILVRIEVSLRSC